jgi:hypothetical protein
MMICVAVRNIVRVFTWAGGRVAFSRELTLSDDVVVLLWCGDRVCAGLSTGNYLYLDALSGSITSELCVDADGNVYCDEESGGGGGGGGGDVKLSRLAAVVMWSVDTESSSPLRNRHPRLSMSGATAVSWVCVTVHRPVRRYTVLCDVTVCLRAACTGHSPQRDEDDDVSDRRGDMLLTARGAAFTGMSV